VYYCANRKYLLSLKSQNIKKQQMRKIFTLLLLGALGLTATKNAQAQRLCTTHSHTDNVVQHDTEAQARRAALEEATQLYIANKASQRSTDTVEKLIIPVVVHILHEYGPENIPKSDVLNAIALSNLDHLKMAEDSNQVLDTFRKIMGASYVELRFAQIDPNGNCTDGITRTFSNKTNDGGDNAGVSAVISWDTKKYMNIYVVRNMQSGAGAYTFNPGTFAPGNPRWAIYCRYNQFGQGGNLSRRTLPHEVGHFYNLSHTWGGTNTPLEIANCNFDDGVDDTPLTVGSSGCNKASESCGSLDNVENIMDYSSCERMFTHGQQDRMRAALMNSGSLNTYHTEQNLIATGTNDGYVSPGCAPIPDFNTNSTLACAGSSLTFTDHSYNAEVDAWEWTFDNGDTSFVVMGKNPNVKFKLDGKYTVQLKVSNANGSDSLLKQDYIEIQKNTSDLFGPITEGFETDPFDIDGWNIINEDNDRTFQRSEQASYTGAASIYYSNVNGAPTGLTDQLISPGINISNMNSPKLSFRMAYARRTNQSADRLTVYVSNNCGLTWKVRLSRAGGQMETSDGPVGGTYFPSSESEWVEQIIDLGAIEGATSGLIRFDFTTGGGNNFYMDNINIYDANPSTSIADAEALKLRFTLAPNPFTQDLSVNFDLEKADNITLEVLDITGRVISVTNETLSAGSHKIKLNANENSFTNAGVYFVRMKTSNSTVTKNVVYTK
jgi:PKD repeat protein